MSFRDFVKEQIDQAIEYAKYVAESTKHRVFILIPVGFLLLIEHVLVFGTPWHVDELVFDHGFIGFVLIVIGFAYGSYKYWRGNMIDVEEFEVNKGDAINFVIQVPAGAILSGYLRLF